MTLPPNFQFSQASLQDYVDCPRRFQLRYLLRVAWPALEAEPALENERHLRQGSAFHRLVHQHALGLPLERLSRTVADEALRRWWRNYLAEPPADLPSSRHPEIVLSAPVGGQRVVAKYDLIAVDLGQRAVIIDWKTSRRRPRRRWLVERLQTRVYPYLLVRAGAHLNGGQPFEPAQVEMVYWFADFPADPARFAYDAVHYEADGALLASLIEEVVGQADTVSYPLTARERRCRYCRYRSLCRRGVGAGPFEEVEDVGEWDDDFDISLDFEQIAEVEYG
jgi:CRISPR/Cas system-associated exonuclease Cas4 (RecB family)